MLSIIKAGGRLWQQTRHHIIYWLRRSEKYTKVDMVYLTSGNFWLIIGRVISIGGGFFLTLALGNLLDPVNFGTYKYILSIASIVGAISLTGLTVSALKEVSQGNQNLIPGLFQVGILWSLPGSFIALLIATYYFLNNNTVIGLSLLIIALVNPLLNNLGLSKSILIGKKDFKTGALSNIPKTIFTIGPLLITLNFTSNIVIVLAVYFLSNLITSWVLYFFVLYKYQISRDDTGLKQASIYGKHMTAISSLQTILNQVDQLLLWHFTGPVQLAVYTFAQAPVRELRNFSDNFFPLIFPKFAIKKIETLKQIMPTRMWQMFGLSGFMAISYFFLAPFFFNLFLPQYTDSIFLSQIMALSLLAQSKGLIDIAIVTHAKTKLRYYAVLFSQFFKLIIMLILIPTYGIMGAAIASVATEFFSAFIFILIFRKIK